MRIFHIAKIRQTARRAKLWAAFLEKTVCRPMYGERGWSVCGVRKGKWAGVPLVFLPAEILYPPAFSIYPPTFFVFAQSGHAGAGFRGVPAAQSGRLTVPWSTCRWMPARWAGT